LLSVIGFVEASLIMLTRKRDDGLADLAAFLNDGEIDRSDLEQFVHWNVLFNAWPYWREYLASTLNRAQLPRFVVPVMGVPRVGAESDDDLASS